MVSSTYCGHCSSSTRAFLYLLLRPRTVSHIMGTWGCFGGFRLIPVGGASESHHSCTASDHGNFRSVTRVQPTPQNNHPMFSTAHSYGMVNLVSLKQHHFLYGQLQNGSGFGSDSNSENGPVFIPLQNRSCFLNPKLQVCPILFGGGNSVKSHAKRHICHMQHQTSFYVLFLNLALF